MSGFTLNADFQWQLNLLQILLLLNCYGHQMIVAERFPQHYFRDNSSNVSWPMTLNKELPRTLGWTSLPVLLYPEN